MVPAKVVSLFDHKTTLPPLPRPRAEALMVVAASTLTVVAVGITKLSSLALEFLTRLVFGLPPPQSPPISTLPPPLRPEASIRALASLMFSPVTRIVPPCVPFFLPAAASVPEISTVWVGAPAGLLVPVAALSTIMPLCLPIELAVITPLVLITESTTVRAELDPPAVRADPALVADQRFERLAGRYVDHLRGDLVADRKRDQLVAVHVEGEAIAGGERHRAERGGDGAGIAHARRHQCGETAARGGEPPLIDDRRIRPARDVEIIPAGHEVGVLDVVGGGEEARRVHHGVGAEQDAVAVDDEHPAVRRQRTEDLRRPEPAGHTVEHDRRGGLI